MTAYAAADLHRLPGALRSPHPYPLLARLREASPFPASDGVVILAKHRHCTDLLRDGRVSSDRSRARIYRGNDTVKTRNLLNLDPPDHTRIRRLISRAFTPRVMAPLVPVIQRKADELIDAAAEKETIDIVGDFASPLPLTMICMLLGIPAADHPALSRWSSALSVTLDPTWLAAPESRSVAAAARAQAKMITYFRAFITSQRSSPQDNLTGDLIRAEEDGGQLSESELLATCVMLVNAAHETTVNLIANGVQALVRHPGQLSRLKKDPALAAAAVEEVLRYDAPVQLTTRVATQDISLDGYGIERGDLLVFLLGAANRDPGVFPAPDEFDIDRPAPVAHLTFTAGPHFCLGSSLGRLEGAIALRTFASRFTGPRLCAEQVAYRANLSLRGPERLEIAFDGRPLWLRTAWYGPSARRCGNTATKMPWCSSAIQTTRRPSSPGRTGGWTPKRGPSRPA
jgi:cytochrome P450